MTRYRKKPVEIEAFQIGWFMDLERCQEWVLSHGGRMTCGQQDHGPAEGYIETLEGVMHVSIGDYVIKGIKGEFYPCKPDIFEASYEVVEDE